MNISRIRFLLLGLFFAGGVMAAETHQADIDRIVESLGKMVKIDPKEVSPTPVPGLYEVKIGAHIFYISADGRYLILGKMTDLETGKDLTEAKVAKARKEAVDAMGEDKMVIFGPSADKARHTITVFTDVDCGYCRKLHAQIEDYNDKGIRVRYLAFPRAGRGSDSWRKAESIWCADDRQAAMTRAKQGKSIPERKCDNPVAESYELGKMVGVTGTPALVLENGELVPGYVPPERLARILDRKFPKK